MAEVKWIKIVTDIFDDEKILLIESMPEADAIIVIWFKLLCMAGKQNNSGVFLMNGRIAYTDEMFATIFRRPVNTVRLALNTFEKFGMIEIVNDTVTIPNWEKHQQLDVLEASREATKNRVARYRAKQKQITDGGKNGCNVTGNVTGDVTVTASNADRIDKNREDKIRIEDIDDDNSAHAQEVNPFGDGDVEDRGVETVQGYASRQLLALGYRAMQEINSFVDDLSEDIVRHAIDNALDSGVRTWSYVRAILNRYVERGVKSVAEAKAEDERRERGKANSSGHVGHIPMNGKARADDDRPRAVMPDRGDVEYLFDRNSAPEGEGYRIKATGEFVPYEMYRKMKPGEQERFWTEKHVRWSNQI